MTLYAEFFKFTEARKPGKALYYLMANHYQILGIEYSATPAQIRTAYKRKAMLYHPDRNPGSKEDEETFKQINEAYHMLSNPIKKARYDAQFNVDPISPIDYQRELDR